MHSGTVEIPVTARLAAAVYLVLPVRKILLQASGDGVGPGELWDVALPVFVAWGLWNLRSWAWWLATIGSAVPLAIAVFFMSRPDLFAEIADAAVLREIQGFVQLVAGLSALELVLLFLPATREAFRG